MPQGFTLVGPGTGHGLRQSFFLKMLQSNRNTDEAGTRQAGKVIIRWREVGDKVA